MIVKCNSYEYFMGLWVYVYKSLIYIGLWVDSFRVILAGDFGIIRTVGAGDVLFAKILSHCRYGSYGKSQAGKTSVFSGKKCSQSSQKFRYQ